jgi:hypothetical protein
LQKPEGLELDFFNRRLTFALLFWFSCLLLFPQSSGWDAERRMMNAERQLPGKELCPFEEEKPKPQGGY